MDKHSLNHMMIPGELADPKMRSGIGYRDEGREKAMYERSLSCDIPAQEAKPSVASEKKDVAPVGKGPSKDYLKAYREKQRQTEATARKHDESEAAQKEKMAQDRIQNDQDTQMRTQARSLTDQINYWKGEHAKSNHDEQTIAGNVSSLERERAAIDPKYW